MGTTKLRFVTRLPTFAFHSINIPSEWGLLNFKPLHSKVSRSSFRRSGKKTGSRTKNQQQKTLKPLRSKRPKFATKKSTFQPFYLTFGQRHPLLSEQLHNNRTRRFNDRNTYPPRFHLGKSMFRQRIKPDIILIQLNNLP